MSESNGAEDRLLQQRAIVVEAAEVLGWTMAELHRVETALGWTTRTKMTGLKRAYGTAWEPLAETVQRKLDAVMDEEESGAA